MIFPSLQIGCVFLYGIPAVCETFRQSVTPHILPVVIPLTQVALTGVSHNYLTPNPPPTPIPVSFPYVGSVYCVVVVAIERYFSVCRPFEQKVIIDFQSFIRIQLQLI